MPQKILILAANPKDTTPLRLDEEVREIDAGLRRALHRDRFVLEQKWAVQPRDIQRAMLDIRPSIVHFSGHGMGDGGLVFEDETGQSKLVDGEALAGLFELFADEVECVVLNGCYSEVQASAIAQHINYVIGMKKAFGDKAAIEFAVGFYDALGSGKPVEFAYKFGCAAIQLAGVSEQLTPIFKKKRKIDEMLVDPDYHNLKELLKAKNWGEADNVTSTIMRTKFGRYKNDALYKSDIKTFPCSHLNIIEELWLKYSENRFGFSKQEQIMNTIDATATEQQRKEDYPWKEFLNQVGWNGKVISEQNAPDGHFPAIGTWWRAYQPGWLEELFSRVRTCQAGK
ncbi:CHAT domain-containing protein [Scytonema sp. UIC 10036]|nr:GUN4 domain-containing protein [Scytonema sp. UIC 10036]MUH00718.1 CHAT domain-containing protein [Scytonema sp. UIC 10036]